MIILIPPDELKIEPSWSIKMLTSVSIDYADSTVWAAFAGQKESLIVCRLKDYGITLDNRRWGYTSSCGEAGLMIKIDPAADI